MFSRGVICLLGQLRLALGFPSLSAFDDLGVNVVGVVLEDGVVVDRDLPRLAGDDRVAHDGMRVADGGRADALRVDPEVCAKDKIY